MIIGIAGALWSASGYVGAFGRAMNRIYDVQEGRPFLKLRPLQLLITLITLTLVALAGIMLVVSGGIAQWVGGLIGLGDTAAAIWSVGRWAAAIAAVLGIYSLIFAFAPDIDARRRRILSPGALVGVGIWILASAGFFVYVSNFGKYGATYGAFAGAVILLLWLYLSSIAFLFGAELNSVVERSLLLAGGDEVGVADLRLSAGKAGPPSLEEMSLEDAERALIRSAIKRNGGSVPAAAVADARSNASTCASRFAGSRALRVSASHSSYSRTTSAPKSTLKACLGWRRT